MATKDIDIVGGGKVRTTIKVMSGAEDSKDFDEETVNVLVIEEFVILKILKENIFLPGPHE